MVLWLINGVWTAFNSVGGYLVLSPGPFVLDLVNGLTFMFGALYVVAALGFNWRKPWSYPLGLLLPSAGLAVFGAFYAYVWVEFGFDPTDLFPFFVGALWFAVVLVYLRRPYVRAFLVGG